MRASAGQGRSKRSDAASMAPDASPTENTHTYYVHLCSGDIIELPLISSIELDEYEITALSGAVRVASFPRCSVYFVSDIVMEPPSLN